MAKKDSTIGKYRVLEEIASGSSGRVYRGEDSQRKHAPIAIKLLHSANLGSQQERDHFLQEARFLTMLKHPNILPVLDVGIEGNLPYIVTEFAPNGSLLDYLKKLAPRPLPTPEALHIIGQVGQALQYAHQQNIIHRDLKPANILFSASGTALLADFGIATVLANSMQYGTVIGTPSYMAPEQFRGTISKEGDQYALGCIAYELVTGRRPFSAADFFTLGSKHMSETPIPPTQLNMLLPRSLEQVIFKAMAKKRTERYSSVAAFIAALIGDAQPEFSVSSQASHSLSSPLSPLPAPPPPVAIINTTTLPSAVSLSSSAPAVSQSMQSAQIPATSVPMQSQSIHAPESMQATAPRLPVPRIPASSTQPPVMRLDKNAPVKPFSPADSLPRAVADMPTPSSSPHPSVGTDLSRPPFLHPSVGTDLSRPPSSYPPYLTEMGINQASSDDDDSVPGRSIPTSLPLIPLLGNSSVTPAIAPVVSPVNSKPSWGSRRKLLTTAVILLIVLLITGSGLFAALKLFGKSASAMSTATVTIVPTNATQSGTYTITAVPGRPIASALQVQARLLSATVRQTNTVASSGVGTIPATVAQGTLTLYNDSTSPQSFAAGTIYTGSDGVQVISMQSAVVPAGDPKTNPPTWQSATVPARAAKVGSAGNIAKTDINVWKVNGIDSSYVVQNKTPFSGGRDTIYYPIVENSDLTSAVTPFTRMLLREAQTAVQAQVQPGEQSVAAARCTQQAIYNHQPGDHVAMVSATLTTTCTLETYDQQEALTLAIGLLRHRLTTGGSNLLLPVFTATVLQAQVMDSKATISLLVKAVSTAFSAAQLQNMARSIAGKSSSDAQTALLRMKGVKQVTIYINNGDGQTLPADAPRISIIVSG
ncbi:MAG TPA: protein kinase [Ktedonobacteraceae bacterium]|nr:protein kinase [Ktedonobacteraceae bacterium]